MILLMAIVSYTLLQLAWHLSSLWLVPDIKGRYLRRMQLHLGHIGPIPGPYLDSSGP